MNTSRKLVGGLIGLLAIAQTGCAALGIAMVGNTMTPGTPIDTAQVLDPNVPTVGQPTQPGNTNLTVKVELPQASAYRTQFVLSEITQLVVGLVDLNTNAATPLYFGYEGSVKKSDTTYHTADTSNVVAELLGNPLTLTQKREFNRYLYFTISGNDARASATRAVTFTNIKPNTSVRAFAVAFYGNGVSKDSNVAGLAESATMTANSTTPAIALNLTLDRGLVNLGGNVTITPATPSASLQ
jgi:hypothetical protein